MIDTLKIYTSPVHILKYSQLFISVKNLSNFYEICFNRRLGTLVSSCITYQVGGLFPPIYTCIENITIYPTDQHLIHVVTILQTFCKKSVLSGYKDR